MLAHHTKIPPNIIRLHLQSHTILHTKIRPHAPVHNILPNFLRYYSYIRLLSTRTNICHYMHKALHNLPHREKLVTRFYHNNQWISKLCTTHWSKLIPPVSSRTPGRCKILLQCHNTTLLYYRPPKILNPANGSLFDLLPPDSLIDIYNWLIGLKYHDKFKHVLSQIKYRGNTILRTLPYEY